MIFGVLLSGCSASDPAASNASSGSKQMEDTSYPEKTVQIIVPAKAGGDTDLAARILTKYLEKEMGVPVVVVNVGGASGTIGTTQVHNAAPDGYTVMFHSVEAFIAKAFDVSDLGVSDFEIAGIAMVDKTRIVCTRKGSPFKNLEELIKAAKAAPGQIEFPAMQPGGVAYAYALIFEKSLGIKLNLTDIDSNGAKVVQLLAGKIDIMDNQYGMVKDYIEKGDFIPLCLITDERNPMIPDIPTLKELGYDLGISLEKYFLFAMPKSTPKPIVEKFSAALKRVVENPAYDEEAKSYFTTPDYKNSADATKFLLDAESDFVKIAALME
jgi:tripartite-type tricarboxylate transporter receptor subunit TctC